MKKSIAVLSSAFLLPILGGEASATQVREMSMPELIEKTSYVFLGTVVETSPKISPSIPSSRVRFSVEMELMQPASYKGIAEKNKPKEVTFEIPGGPLPDGTSLRIDGAPIFVYGQKYLIFVRDGDWVFTPSTNWYHSAFRIESKSGQSVLVNETGECVTDIGELHPFEIGPQIVTEFSYPTQPGNPKSGIRGWVSDQAISEEELANSIGRCIPLYKAIQHLTSLLPRYKHDAVIMFRPSTPSITQTRNSIPAPPQLFTPVPEPSSGEDLICDPELLNETYSN